MTTLAALEAGADRFLARIDLTPQGRALYARALADFLNLLEDHPALLHDPDVLLHARAAFARRLRPPTVAFKMHVVRRFLDFLRIEGALPPAWAAARERERLLRGRARDPRVAPRDIPPPEALRPIADFLRARVAAATGDRRLAALRDWALAEVLAATGLRISEALSLRTRDVFRPDGSAREEVLVRAKGRREERVFLPAPARQALEAYFAAFRAAHPRRADRAEWVFVSFGRGRRDGRPISRQHAWAVFRAVGKALGLPLFPHAFRHMLARDLLRRGVDLPVVQGVLRHRHPATTLRYAEAHPVEVRNVLEGLAEARRRGYKQGGNLSPEKDR